MSSTAESVEAFDERKLLITAIQDKARWTPTDTYMRYPPSDWQTSGYKTITWYQYLRAIDKVAYWLDSKLGKSAGYDTIAYAGPNDPRYAILLPASIKTGRNLLVPDGRVTEEGLHGLIRSTGCKAWIYAEDDPSGPLITGVSGLQYQALPSLHSILEEDSVHAPYRYNKTFDQGCHDVIAIIHTSGTTGVPKPIYHTNGLWSAMGSAAILSQRHWPRGLAHESFIGRNGLNCCAPQWLAGLSNMTLKPVFADSPCIMLPPDAVGLTPELFKQMLRMNKIDGLKCPPHTITTLYDDLETRQLLKSLKYIMFLGAALDRAIGDDLCKYIRLTPLIGSTETGDQMSLRPASRELWYTHDWVPENGDKMVPINSVEGTNGDLHELVIERSTNEEDSWFQPAFWNPAYRGFDRIETKELYTPTTDSDGRTRWIFAARKDDLTKLNWLAKFHAQDIEARIQEHPKVKSVVVGGEGRPTPYVIIEAKEEVLDPSAGEALLDDLYATTIAATNKADIDEIRIPRETLILASAKKPFKRNVKQVILRKEVEKDYQQEIEQAYLRLQSERKP